MVVAESRLVDGVFAAPYDEAAFSEVVGKAVAGVAQFGEGIIHGRRRAVLQRPHACSHLTMFCSGGGRGCC